MGRLRKSKITDEIITEILAMRRKGVKMVCIALDLNISVGTVHKYLRKYGNEQKKI
jgi:DNA-binding NarL/FixJ family response regulator